MTEIFSDQELTAGHFLCEKHDHLCEVDGAGGLWEHALGLTIGNGFADSSEGSYDIWGGKETILITVHDTERFFELLDLPLGEKGEDVGAALLGLPDNVKKERTWVGTFGFLSIWC